MKIIDCQNELTFIEVSKPADRTSTVTTSGVDLQGYQGVIKVTQRVAAVSGTPTLDGAIEDSADNSNFAAVTGYTFTQVTAADNIQSIGVDTRKVRRYVRYVGTIGGGTPHLFMTVDGIGQKQTI